MTVDLYASEFGMGIVYLNLKFKTETVHDIYLFISFTISCIILLRLNPPL